MRFRILNPKRSCLVSAMHFYGKKTQHSLHIFNIKIIFTNLSIDVFQFRISLSLINIEYKLSKFTKKSCLSKLQLQIEIHCLVNFSKKWNSIF